MKSLTLALALLVAPLFAAADTGSATAAPDPQRIVLVVHGGAGTISRSTITPEIEAQYRAGLENAMKAGYAVLAAGGSSVDAVVATIRVFEDDPLFNAGKGAVLDHDGKAELDAAIMDGRTGQAGAIAGATTIKNPITAARAVMDRTKHVLLVGTGADRFAAAQKLDIVDPAYFITPRRYEQWQKAREKDRIELDHDGKQKTSSLIVLDTIGDSHKYGTVGALALDRYGNLAAGTSTGGLTNKMIGRVGDSPIIGAGTYADNATVAVSGTGTGEFYMRGLVAYDIAARMKYLHLPLDQAVDETTRAALDDKHGEGGLIALDAKGNFKFWFNTSGMYRGYIKSDGKPVTFVYKD